MKSCYFNARHLQRAAWVVLFFVLVNPAVRSEDLTPDQQKFEAAEPSSPADWYGQTIRETPARNPQEELAGFHLPAGFSMSLVASEPAIAKPMNMAFDARGRLWVTQSYQYPFPAKEGEEAKDSIVVLEDVDKDGTYEKVTTFADGLNIPIGLLPYEDGVLCFSIPNIWMLRDTDGDGKCDSRKVILGPFDTTRDTHGMVNAFRWGPGGWVYACHGFNNRSRVQGTDGHAIEMSSGNIFRFRPDGSRVEVFTHGQVNPFGIAFDGWGNLYSADCHSKPVSQLIRNGCYPSFGRPDDGLGFVPAMMDHLHGSTAICGLAYSDGKSFPSVFSDNLLSGNVMTCRINRNHIDYLGATAKAIEQADFLTSDDPWFRPVDLMFGPDGCLYVADFYNKIIGHYEVPLDHPDRDRFRGRIWKIRYDAKPEVTIDKTARSASSNGMAESDAELRTWSERLITTDIGGTVGLLNRVAHQSAEWRRLNVRPDQLSRLCKWCDGLDPAVTGNAMAIKATVELLGLHGQDPEALWLGSHKLFVEPSQDVVLKQAIKIAIRDILRRLNDAPKTFDLTFRQLTGISRANPPQTNATKKFQQARSVELMPILLSLKSSLATHGALDIVDAIARGDRSDQQRATVRDFLGRLSETIEAEHMDRFLTILKREFSDQRLYADQLLSLAQRQLKQRGALLDSLRTNGQEVLVQLAKRFREDAERDPQFQLMSWSALSNGDSRPWPTEERQLKEPDTTEQKVTSAQTVYSSIGLGEPYVGTWTSSAFAAPETLRFWVVGHNGKPADPDSHKNYIRLYAIDRDGNETRELQRAYPPRSDIGTFVSWNLKDVAKTQVQLQVVDGDSGDSFAWIAIGNVSLPGLRPSELRADWNRIVAFVDVLDWPASSATEAELVGLMQSNTIDWQSKFSLNRKRFAGSLFAYVELLSLASQSGWFDLIDALVDNSKDAWDWSKLAPDALDVFAKSVCKRCSAKQQESLVTRLAANRNGWPLLAALVDSGTLSQDSLRSLAPTWWDSLPKDSMAKLLARRPSNERDDSRQTLIDQRLPEIRSASVDLMRGKAVFIERCSICHRLGDVGQIIGPQLDGVGNRGVERLTEDLLWPSRNVDEAFRMSSLLLESGEVLTGLISQRTDDSLTITNQQGVHTRVLLSDIDTERTSQTSLMPGNFDELMTNQDVGSLIAFLKETYSKKAKP